MTYLGSNPISLALESLLLTTLLLSPPMLQEDEAKVEGEERLRNEMMGLKNG